MNDIIKDLDNIVEKFYKEADTFVEKVKAQQTATEPYTKVIECPDCASSAKLYTHGHLWAGIWECENPDCAVSDACEHKTYHEEEVEDTRLGAYGIPYEVKGIINVCDDCEETVEVYHYDS